MTAVALSAIIVPQVGSTNALRIMLTVSRRTPKNKKKKFDLKSDVNGPVEQVTREHSAKHDQDLEVVNWLDAVLWNCSMQHMTQDQSACAGVEWLSHC